MTQYARPDSNVTTTGFTGSYTDIDETAYDMSDYISGDNANNQTDYYYEVGLTNVTDPGVGTGHVLSATWNMSSSQSHTIKIRLYQGGTQICEALNWTGTFNTGSPTGGGISTNNLVEYTLTEAQANSITDYSDLRIRFYLKKNTSSGGRTGRWGWAELAVPDASVNITVNSGNPPGTTVGGNTNTTVSTSSDVSIDSGTTNIAVDAIDSFVEIGTPIFITVTNTPNINIAANAATISTTSNVEIFEGTGQTNILIAGKDATITVEVNAIINAEVTNILVHNEQANVITEQFTEIAVNESNIQVGGDTNVLELYTALVLKHDPWNYFKSDKLYTTQGTLPDYVYYGVRKNMGSNTTTAKHMFVSNYTDDTKQVAGIPGDPISMGLRFVGTVDGVSNDVGDFNMLATSMYPLEPSVTYEFWIKTASTNFPILAVDKTNTSTNRNSAYIGLVNGYLAIVLLGTPGSSTSYVTDTYIANNAWHHVVFTKETVGSTITYKSYVDGEETNDLLSIAPFINYIDQRHSIMDVEEDLNSQPSKDYNYDVTIDEIAIYKKALTKAEIQEHTKSGVGYTGVTVNASVTDIEINETTTSFSTVINAQKSNINISALGSVITTDNVLVIATVSNVELDGQDFTTTNDSSIELVSQKANVSINGKNSQISTIFKNFKFISAQDTSLSANDATAITSLEYGGLLYNQVKKQLFRIGNTANIPTKFVITATSNETGLIPAIKLSLDNITFSSSVTIDVVKENNISDIIYVKFDTNVLDVLGPGTFLINVEQINV